jgi:hypothetical protein
MSTIDESARGEALRLAREAGFDPDFKFFPEAESWLGKIERLIALARQRPGWVWAPQEPTPEMIRAIVKSYEDRQLYTRKLRVSAGEYAADDYKAALAAAPGKEPT